MDVLRRLALWTAMFALTGAVILAGTELVMRRLGPRDHVTHHRFGNRPYALLPNVVHRAVDDDFDVSFRANSLGFNDVEHALEKQPGRFRLLLLGDSFVEGHQVAPEKNVARRLEQLAARDGRALEVIGMGISGYGQSHELATYEVVGRPFYADEVVLFFCPNDVWNNLVGVEGEDGPPFYTIGTDGELVATLAGAAEVPPPPELYAKHERKPRFPGLRAARRLAKDAVRMLNGDARGAARAGALAEMPGDERPRKKDRKRDVAAGPPGVRADQKILFEKLVHRMKADIVDRDGSSAIAVIVSGNPREEPKRGYLALKRWVTDTFAREGIATLDLDALFRARAKREGRYPSWEDDLHWNETGHAWAGDALYAEIAPLLGAAHGDRSAAGEPPQ
jgi:lysophospholipase L1-like esterase